MDKILSSTAPGSDHVQQAQPIDAFIVQKAAQWMARLWSEDAGQADYAGCRQWRAEHPDNERAWRRLQAFDEKLQGVPQHASSALLKPATKNVVSRRRALQLVGLAVIATGTAPIVQRSGVWHLLTSTYSTKVGETREVALDDGTHVLLNAASAIEVRFDGVSRTVFLRTGEILITTSHDPAQSVRPFVVQSHQGTVRALGTRFTVAQDKNRSRVAVFEGAVQLHPAHASKSPLRLEAGQGTSFTDSHAQPPKATTHDAPPWSQGLLVAENMRVQDFVHELGRYRTGFLHCAPEVEDLKITGVFPLADTDRALANLQLALPVRLTYRTRYWVTVQAR